MADQNPTDRELSGLAPIDPEEARTENSVLSLLIGEYPVRLTLDEIAVVLHSEPRLSDPHDAAEVAVYRLLCFGLIHRDGPDGSFLVPTRAALRFERLRADS